MARDYVLKVRLTEKEKRTLERQAKAEKVSISEVVRDWIKSLFSKVSH